MKNLVKKVQTEFTNNFGDEGILIQAPGRVELIGGHTDYNEGFVVPAAVDKIICLAMGPNNSENLRFYSIDKDDSFTVDVTKNLGRSEKGWPNYLLGVVDQLQQNGYDIGGFDCVFSGNVPIGAGMSSSAALEGGVAFGLSKLFDLDIAPEEMAKLAQKAENDFVGVQCGIMDQFISLNGKKNHVMKLDCRSLAYEHYPFKHENVHFLVCDTQVRRELASSEYNVRRSQCEEGVTVLQQYDDSIQSLRDVSIDLLHAHKDDLSPVVFNRCNYIVNENMRVLQACEDLENDDLEAFGRRMYASHEGLRDKYEVSCNELDVLVAESRKVDGVYGARMMGGGFGGCTVNLVESDCVSAFEEHLTKAYHEQTGLEVKIYETKVSSGTHEIKSSKTSVEL